MNVGPQMNIPVGESNAQAGGWNGMTIKDILEKVDLFNITVESGGGDSPKDEKVIVGKPPGTRVKDGKTIIDGSNPEAAFLGPRLWDKTISVPSFDETELSIMNIDDFLNENNINLDDDSNTQQQQHQQGEQLQQQQVNQEQEQKMGGKQHSSNSQSSYDSYENIITMNQNAFLSGGMAAMSVEDGEEESLDEEEDDEENIDEVSHGVNANDKNTQQQQGLKRKNNLPKDQENDFLYAESKRARAEREKEEKKRKIEQIDFSPEDLALATIPGADFDPRRRAFTVDELKPQPIIRKRKKHYVPNEGKDDKYWEKRIKNNIAARRSREARRLKENQIALRAAFLEKQNGTLKNQMKELMEANKKLAMEKANLQAKIRVYEGK